MDPQYSNERTIKKYGFLNARPPAEEMNDRMVVTNVPDEQVPDNSIRTAKYTYATFIPLNLIEQFSKLANVYFLVIGVMQMIKAISITNGQPVIFAPLSIVVGISMLKDFIEDYNRHKSDNEENNKQVGRLRNGAEYVPWSELRIGDMIRVQQDQQIPADILIVKTSDAKGNCYIETKNLDGETNLKNKILHKDMFNLQKSNDSELEALRISINYEKPNPYLYRFNGSASVNGHQVPLDDKNFILRGCQLRNTQYIYGIVCYTGHDTKIMLNSVKARPKKSHLEVTMNLFIIIIFGIQMIMCFIAAFINSIWQQSHNSSLSYLDLQQSDPEFNFGHNLLLKWGNWVLIFTNFVPISLLVSLEMVKYFQGMFISADPGTYSQEYDIKTSVQSSNLNEELGQVEYIFSDKTGTLTKNLMDFKCLTVNGKSYGNNIENQSISARDQQQKFSNVDFIDSNFLNDLKHPQTSKPLQEFLQCLALCHTILTEEKNGQISYQASSPDEMALINFARQQGYVYEGLDQANYMNLNAQGSKQQFQLLHVLEFNSTRKRMSVILQDKRNNIILYTKGADSVIEKRMKYIDPKLKNITWQHLQDFAVTGLRTLILAKREITISEYQAWATKYNKASSQIQNREQAVMDCQEEIEKDLELVGGTAIEDKLQEDVGPTISYIKEAGIHVWVLTGDKIETAINIGYSCQLLNDQLKKIIIDGTDEKQVVSLLDQGIQEVQQNNKFALIISGDALIVAMKDLYSYKVMQIAEKCEAVVACRVSPKQKAEIVQLVRREKPKVTTLAIGDGANDVNMITAAHVGIGIKGVEGQAASRASDYSVGEFRMLRRLTLFHGRECYRRNSHLVLYNFYKNMLLVLPQYWWAIYNGYSAVNLYDAFLYQSYNLFFTSLPIILYAIFDEEYLGDHFVQSIYFNFIFFQTLIDPQLYEIGIKYQLFNPLQFIKWILNGALQAAVQGLFLFQLLASNSIYHGYMPSIWSTGAILIGLSIINSNLKIVLFTHSYTFVIIFVLFGSVGVYILMYLLISGFSRTSDIYNTISWNYGHLQFYFVTVLIIGSTTLIDLAYTRYGSIMHFLQHDKHVELHDENQQNDTKINQKPLIAPNSARLGHTGYAFSQEDR